METSLKEQFRMYLANCVQTRRQIGKNFIIGRTTVDSYVSFAEVDKLFDYAPEKWQNISSIYDITSSKKIFNIIEELSNDNDFKIKDSSESSQYFRSNAIKQYYCFLKVREIFTEKKDRKSSNSQYINLQQIFYGAPGTGKSNEIKKVTKDFEREGRVFRTTFHPDSDYSTFVGCYKPTKSKSKRQPRMNLSLEDLAKELGSYYSNEELGKIAGIQKFCFEYFPYIDGEYMSVNITKLLELAGVPKDYNVEINKYIKFCHLFPKQDLDKITYEFIPQAFTNAYIAAWNTTEDIYLIIEEINRGNCAQIFGDLFQLLDRGDDGFSEYPIDADNDFANYIAKELENSTRTDFPDGVKDGTKLVLPSNLYIWATMNTSDQSLFPIDSAFKRRWDWKYMKIRKGKDENGNELDWKIVVKDKDKNIVKINNEDSLSWWNFIEKINEIIASMTSSADKQLGYFFCKADEKVNEADRDCTIISANTFVGKVLFYLWNDVFKDYGFEDASLFRYKEIKDGKETEKDLTYPDFYDEDGENVNTTRVVDFVQKVMNWKKKDEENN